MIPTIARITKPICSPGTGQGYHFWSEWVAKGDTPKAPKEHPSQAAKRYKQQPFIGIFKEKKMENLFYETLMTSCHLLRTCTFFTYQEHCHFNVAVLLIVISAPQEDNFLPASPQWQFLIQSIKYQDLKPWSTSR